MPQFRFSALAALGFLLSHPAAAQVSNNASLKGNYHFRQVLLITDGTANVTGTRTGFGTITFDGNGGFTYSGQLLAGSAAPAPLAAAGTYSVKPGGFVTLTNPLRPDATVNARLGTGAVAGSSTEAGATVFDLFIAIAAPAQAPATVAGPYWISTLEFPNGGTANIRESNFKLTANGAGSFSESSVTGQARNLGNRLITQTVSPLTYSVSADGTGTVNFPASAGLDATTQLVAGTKTIYVSQDATVFIGGSTSAGGHGIIAGVKAPVSGASWNGFFVAAGMRYDAPGSFPGGRLASTVGAVNATALGSVWARRTRQSDGLFDASQLLTYNLNADGSGSFVSTTGHVNVASSGQNFVATGVDTIGVNSYEFYFGSRMPAESGTGVFLNPQGVLNAASFAPPGYPLSPGGVVTLYGSGFGSQNVTASSLPFPKTLAGVQVTINNLSAPIYAVGGAAASPFVSAVVPFEVAGSTATITVTVNNNIKSNSVEVPLARTAPGIFSLAQNGLGDGAVLHADYRVVDSVNPAVPGETVQVFLTGLGAVSPAVADGAPAPGQAPFPLVTADLRVTVGGQVAAVAYQGLAPALAGLYQLNVQIPPNLGPGVHSLAVQTTEGFTDLVSIRVSK
jgi:uncharacterized protein (TIGR03437 family)